MCSGATPSCAEAALDPLRAPGVEPPAVVGEPPREAGVVDEPSLEQLRRARRPPPRGDPLLGEDAAQLELRAVAAVHARQATARACSMRGGVAATLARRCGRRAVLGRVPATPTCESHGRRVGPSFRAATAAAASRPRRRPARGRSASRGPGRCQAPRRPWTRSPWRPRRARPDSPWRCCDPDRAATTPRAIWTSTSRSPRRSRPRCMRRLASARTSSRRSSASRAPWARPRPRRRWSAALVTG